MEKKKVLILYASLGAGHGAAAKAIAEAFAFKYPDIEIKNIDVLDFYFNILKKGLPGAFVYINSKIPFLYGEIYKYSNHQLRYKFLNYTAEVFFKKSQFIKFIKEFNPDFIISTNPLPMQLISRTKEKNIIDTLSANVCTDFGFHSFWYNLDVNYYFVANNIVKNFLISHSVKEQLIEITGIPIGQKFNQKLDRPKILKSLGFYDSRPIILIVGGKITHDDLFKILKGIKNKKEDVQFIIVAGRDDKLKKQLEQSKIKNNFNARIFGFINNLEEYMEVSDLILTKAGGLTMSECLAKGLPMVINDIIPVQEEDNLNYVIAHNAGIDARSIKKSIDSILELSSDPTKLQKMKENCKKIAKPDAPRDLVDFVVSKIQ